MTGLNRDRAAIAGQRDAAAALAVLRAAPPALTVQGRDALRLRVDYPDASLAELARRAGCGKDTFAGRLRRALKTGDKT